MITVYNKAASISRMRADNVKIKRVVDRIQLLKNRLDQKKESMNQHRKIVHKACKELLTMDDDSIFRLRNHVVEEIDRLYDTQLERYMFYRYRYEVNPVKRIVDNYPPCVQIEPTSICNFRCVFCFQTDNKFTDKKSGHMGTMDIDLFKNLIDQLEGEVEAVSMASRGEPLLSKYFNEMLKYISGKFLAIKVNTNASLLNERISHAILESDIQTLVFSVDAAREPLYSRLRVNGKLERVENNIRRFMKIKRNHYPKSKLITRVSGVFCSDEQNAQEMENFWGELVDQVVFVDYNPWENIYEGQRSRIETPCSDLWRRLFIWWDGRINPCDVDYMSTLSPGVFRKREISEFWQSDFMENLRRKHLVGHRQKLYPCSGCFLV